jgi:glycosyltransferase involved in cell wall biosynthesis
VSELHAVLPNDIDDPARPSGGNAYDRRLLNGLRDLGWTVREHAAHGAWPTPSDVERAALSRLLAGLPDRSLMLIDGLVASAVPEVLTPERDRLRLVVLMHMPLGDAAEERALAAARQIITTSEWTKTQLLRRYPLSADRLHAAPPGVDPAPAAHGADNALLTVGTVSPHKGHDLLVEALASLGDLSWTCTCVGSLDRDPDFVRRLRKEPVTLTGPLAQADLDIEYQKAGLFVFPTRGETYGMVVTEALARGIPVLAAQVGGVPEALGYAPDGTRPGLLVPPEDPAALARALRRWLTEPALREALRRSARARSTTLSRWSDTARITADVLVATQ